jgi:hypothetical protein
MILAANHHDGRFAIERIAGFCARPGAPAGTEDWLELVADLRIKCMRG